MIYKIAIEDLVANALIGVLSSNPNKRFLSYQDIQNYGSKVVRILESESETVVMLLSRSNTIQMLRDYSDFFDETSENGLLGIQLKEDKGVDDLINKFRGYLSLTLLKAFIDCSKEFLNVK